ncbi:TetR/AcrR family transcriptional regulator [Mycobacterium avium]|nr:TetR/AcrR family transcriptional regulator [Mycobacterium avium]
MEAKLAADLSANARHFPIRQRRPAAESRELVSQSARRLFGAKGFANTTIRDIARESGVAEVVIYRLFGSKANLFDQVMGEHLAQFLQEWLDAWRARAPDGSPLTDLCRAYVRGLFAAVRANRGALLALLAAEHFEPDLLTERLRDSSPVSNALDEMSKQLRDWAALEGWMDLDSTVTTRAGFGMVLSNALLLDWLYPLDPDRPSEDRIIDELTAFIESGVTNRAPHNGQAPTCK